MNNCNGHILAILQRSEPVAPGLSKHRNDFFGQFVNSPKILYSFFFQVEGKTLEKVEARTLGWQILHTWRAPARRNGKY